MTLQWRKKQRGWTGTQRPKITEKVHKPPRNHYIEWPVFTETGLNCKSQGEKGRKCKKYKILIGSRVFFFHFIHDFPFSPRHLLESEEMFVNLCCNFSPLCGSSFGRWDIYKIKAQRSTVVPCSYTTPSYAIFAATLL